MCNILLYICKVICYILSMIKSVKHRGLKELLTTGRTSKINASFLSRLERRLNALDAATSLKDLDFPGFRLHSLHTKPVRYAIDVNGPWRLTFEFDNGDAYKLDFEQYH